MFSWRNRENDVVEICMENPLEQDAVVEEAAKIKGLIDISSNGENIHFMMKKCSCLSETSVIKRIDEFKLLHFLPFIYNEGWEYYRLIAFKHDDLKGFLDQLDSDGFVFNAVRKAPFDGSISSSLTLTTDTLFADLTCKQIDALLTAYSHGYYRLPRGADIQTIAARKDSQ